MAFRKNLNSSAINDGDVEEHIPVTVIRSDKAETLLAIEPFHCAVKLVSRSRIRARPSVRRSGLRRVRRARIYLKDCRHLTTFLTLIDLNLQLSCWHQL